jgi:phosphatidylglycerol---prolipoprotein diacylglyceryl transferase
LPTYGAVLAGAYLTGIWLLRRRALREGLPEQQIFDLSLYILAAAILGAKLLLVIVEWKHYLERPADLVDVLRSGGVFYGGLIAATVVAIVYMRKHNLPAWRVLDMAVPSVALGEAIGRWGCFAAGCCYGKQWNGPWAVTFSDPFAHEAVGTPTGVPLHPTQIYLSINAFVIFVILTWAWRRRSFDGEIFCLYVLLYAISRGVLEIFRGDLVRGFVVPGILSTSQFIGLIAAIASIGLMVYLSRRQRQAA